ncbi:helicase C-terminal domain-containing protein [Methanobrevibacter filiformis]|uniref:Bifunctional ATP-dependent DNA helicase/DNA polymerase III subunit epsilon n=1 Tax=Methanobrevibacter filiformis TaxID=55758 RepID=A0A165Z4Z2_9EURY|nr:ATP-dependent DNA helicase [Methanobrevibacter filiformis]KZX10253.1 bifunctional ATP-dependent DNA helicase/DNA polymerase III subunit epsilon [Methanobrevibacter filiformis]
MLVEKNLRQNIIHENYVNNNKLNDKLSSKLNDLKIISKEIEDNFPFDNPREGQLEIISEIDNAIKNGYKYIVLEAGTGTGKSVIAATLAKIYNPSFILTMTKQLQEQYINDFGNLGFQAVKGRNNFKCLDKLQNLSRTSKDLNCDSGSCMERYNFNCGYGLTNIDSDDFEWSKHAFKKSSWRSNTHCKYLDQKSNGINCDTVIMNYDYGLYEFNYPHDFKKRELLILDEAHNIEKKIMSFVEIEISKEELKNEIKIEVSSEEIMNMENKGSESWLSFINFLIRKYKKELKKVKTKVKSKNISKNNTETERTIHHLKEEIEKYKRFVKYIEKDPKNWVMVHNKESLYFKPLKIHEYAKEYLLKFGEVCLFMSATILDYKHFVKWLGLNPKEVYSIKVETPFSSDKRPINSTNNVDMKFNTLSKNAPKTIKMIKNILDNHEDEKGLIHAVSYQCAQYIANNINDPRVITHNSDNRTKILRKFEKSKKPLVLLSPSMSEGIDLPYEKCRFQIIYKLPFPSTMDKQVNMRAKKDRYWYPYQTIMNLVQTYGRGMRAEDDYCNTYILDSRLKFYTEESPLYRRLVPKFFKEAII